MTEMYDNSRPIRRDDEDAEGHKMLSDRNVKEDIQPVDHGDEVDDDTEGHRNRW